MLVIALAFLVYRLVLKPTAPTDNLIGLAPAGLSVGIGLEGNDAFVRSLLDLKDIDLSGAKKIIPLLVNLTDFSTELKPQIPGRPNPFAPIGRERFSGIVETTAPNASSTAID